MPATYQQLMQRSQAAIGGNYTPSYEEDYRRRMQERFAQEIPAAQALTAAAMSPDMLAKQRLQLGQGMQQQAVGAASSNPLAARAAQFGGAQQAFGASMAAGQEAQNTLEQAKQAEMGAYMRQIGYGQGLQAQELKRQEIMQNAMQNEYEMQRALQAQKDARRQALLQGGIQAGVGALGTLGSALGKAFG